MARRTFISLGLFLFGFVVLYAAYGMVSWAVTETKLNEASRSWPTFTGEIVESLVRNEGQKLGSTPIVRYKYIVHSVQYEGNRINFGSTNLAREAASTVVEKYRAGTAVSVFVNPTQPTISVLQRTTETPAGVMSAIVGSVICLVIGIRCIVLCFQKKKRAS